MLNPKLDVGYWAKNFAVSRRVQILDVLLPEAAERLYACLAHEVPWGIAFTDGVQANFLGAQEIAGFRQQDWLALANKAQACAIGERQFRFIYNSYKMVEAYKQQRDPGLILHHVLEFINSDGFLGLMRGVTGITDIHMAIAQATRYLPGHFLTAHNDIIDKENRRVAYVLNLTKGWRADWGGLLQFTDGYEHVIATCMPTFNSLTLFEVPMWHHVSYVSPFASQGRYAITGWGLARTAGA